MSTDRITLTGLRAKGFHGVFEHEKREGQDFVVDLVLELPLEAPGHSDDLADTLSYAEVADAVVAVVTGPPFDLIERLARVIADRVLALSGLLRAVEVTVHKPQAPIPQEFADVSVTMRREQRAVVIAMGANLGDRVATLAEAVGALAERGVHVTGLSPLVETDPVGGPDQPDYLNAVLVGRTSLEPEDLLELLLTVEREHGRTRDVRWGARTLDLDLIQAGTPGEPDEVLCSSEALDLPHPRAHERAFVLVPWTQADPYAALRRPGGAVVPVAEQLRGLDASGVRSGPAWPDTILERWALDDGGAPCDIAPGAETKEHQP